MFSLTLLPTLIIYKCLSTLTWLLPYLDMEIKRQILDLYITYLGHNFFQNKNNKTFCTYSLFSRMFEVTNTSICFPFDITRFDGTALFSPVLSRYMYMYTQRGTLPVSCPLHDEHHHFTMHPNTADIPTDTILVLPCIYMHQ